MVSVLPPGRLVHAMQLPVQSQPSVAREPWESSAGPDELVAIARKADETGFAYLAVSDHVVVDRRPPSDRMGPGWYDTIATLAYLAAITSHVRLLSSIAVIGYRHPLVTAKQWTTLDRLSGGRAILGVGVGWIESEFGVLGASYSGRGALADEAIDVVRACFLAEYPVVSTPTWSLDGNFGVAPRPVQSPVPIWIGGRGKPALRRVAERGDGWIPQGTPRSEIAAEIAYIEAHRARVGRSSEAIDYGYVSGPMYVGTPPFDVSDRPTISGSPSEVAASMRALGDLGINHVQVRFRSRTCAEFLDQMDAFAADVVPLLND
jgi:probable F420-dependent oxidoreductase